MLILSITRSESDLLLLLSFVGFWIEYALIDVCVLVVSFANCAKIDGRFNGLESTYPISWLLPDDEDTSDGSYFIIGIDSPSFRLVVVVVVRLPPRRVVVVEYGNPLNEDDDAATVAALLLFSKE